MWDPGGPQTSLFVLCVAVVEMCGGKGGITQRCTARGFGCGHIIKIQRGWDLLEEGLFERLLRLAIAGRVWRYALKPLCTSFSLARKTRGSRHGHSRGALAGRPVHIAGHAPGHYVHCVTSSAGD